MFVRKKKNPSGVISIQIIDKSSGKYRVIKTIGSSSDKVMIEKLFEQGKQWISSYLGEIDFFEQAVKEADEKQVIDFLLSNVENILLNGAQILLNKVFASIGFDKIEDDSFRQLVLARLDQPLSKAATVHYLKSHFNEDVQLHKIYRYLDKLYYNQQERIQQISVEHTQRVLGGRIGLLFYDVTTLYFETDEVDELRNNGWSKDGKHSQPQVVLGLLVSSHGYPLSYSLFNGSQYEGQTMLPIVHDFVHRFKLEQFVVVADSGLMNATNRSFLESSGYAYILGARIKSESNQTKQQILALPKLKDAFHELEINKARLIIGYSEKRAKKDQYNREKGLKRLKKAYSTGKITKENINKRGYNKFLKIDNDVKITIDEDSVKEDQKWDGLKGYLTNTSLTARQVYEQYNGLWVIERAFRITKGTIELRPVFHFTAKRIEAHICICFASYKVYKEVERILILSKIPLSVDKVIAIAKTITTIQVKLPTSKTTLSKTMILTPKQREIQELFNENFWKSI